MENSNRSVPPLGLLSEPWLQGPTPQSIQVVWCTAFPGQQHVVVFGEQFEYQVEAVTTTLTRLREDHYSCLSGELPTVERGPQGRRVWRHQATIAGLSAGQRYPYRVQSTHDNGQVICSNTFTLAATPPQDQDLKILLTSDHQLKPMVAANLQKVVETVGLVDAVFYAGDLVNVPDRASEWFDDGRGRAWFPCLQGRAICGQDKLSYVGGALIQSAPIFLALGNHEVMGRYCDRTPLHEQFRDATPRWVAQQQYQIHPAVYPVDALAQEQWLQDHSFNTRTVDELFAGGLPSEHYYTVTFGDICLIVLFAANVFRTPAANAATRGKYQERLADLDNPQAWGYGQHIFAALTPGSEQYQWLQQQLASDTWRQAKYKIAMLHHPPHSLGGNVVPPFTDPIQIQERDAQGQLQTVRYDYPQHADYLIRDVLPLLEAAGVQLVYYGHSHLWNRFVSPQGVHYLESSNVGNSYGAHVGDNQRLVPDNTRETYAVLGNPNGLEPVIPNIAPLCDQMGNPLPYIASNEITVFSILETGAGTVSSYRFDTSYPSNPVIKFDEFSLQSFP